MWKVITEIRCVLLQLYNGRQWTVRGRTVKTPAAEEPAEEPLRQAVRDRPVEFLAAAELAEEPLRQVIRGRSVETTAAEEPVMWCWRWRAGDVERPVRSRRCGMSGPVQCLFGLGDLMAVCAGPPWVACAEFTTVVMLTEHRINPRHHWHSRFSTTYLSGGIRTPLPRLSRLLLVVEKNGKGVRKLVKNDFETILVNFSLRSKLWPPGPKMAKFSSFSRLSNTVSETSIISGTG